MSHAICSMDGNQHREDERTCSTSGLESLTKERIRILQRHLLRWYARHGRNLPWRHTRDPYHILVSEMMLHQTQVARAIRKYREWLAVYPTFEALAAAPLEEVKQLWRPLGYNYRPERLYEIANIVVDKLGGKLPNRLDDLLALPGIGRYTAGAVLSFAFHQDAPIVDTNVRRLIARIFGILENPMRAASKREIWDSAERVIPTGQGYIFNQALLDFGALICTARHPACAICFVNQVCAWRQGRKRQDMQLP